MARRLDLSRCAPPGHNWRGELQTLALALTGGTALLGYLFGNAYIAQRETELSRYRIYAAFPERMAADHVSRVGLQPFWALAGRYLSVLPILGLLLLCFGAAAKYLRFHSGARSDYTLRRLRDPREYRRRCLALPAIEAALCLLAFALLTGVCYWIYLQFTPVELLPPVGRRFWG